MALLGVVTVELLAGLADLLDDQVRLMALGDALDRCFLVSRHDDEAVALRHDTLVVRGVERDRLETRCAPALAVVLRRPRHAVHLDALLDSGVHVSKDFLVPGCPLCEVHAPILPRALARVEEGG